MSIKATMVRSATLLGSGQVLGQGCSFIRNIILARLLGPEDMGIASTFALTVALFNMASELAPSKLLIQARDGDEPRFQGTIQLVSLVKGLLNGTLIFLLAWPITRLFGVPDALWAFQVLALVPVIRGLVHGDLARLQRHMRFRPTVQAEVMAQLVALAAAWPLAVWVGNYSAVLWVVMCEALTRLVVSHVIAERRYRLACDIGYLKRVFGFGWPLMINGLLMFGTLQGDRVIVGSFYTMQELGVYAVAFGLTLVPTLMLMRVSSSIMLPTLANANDDHVLFQRRVAQTIELLAVLGAMLTGAFVLVGGFAVQWLYGSAYAAAGAYIGWLAATQAVRLLKAAPNQAAMARGETTNTLLANVVRSLALVLALIAAMMRAPLVWIAIAGIVGELASLFLAMWLLHRKHSVQWYVLLRPILPGAAMLSFVMVVGATLPLEHIWLAIGLAAVLGFSGLVYTLVRFDLRRRGPLCRQQASLQ